MEYTGYKYLFKYLEDGGFAVYTPGQKQGECIAPYVVLKDAGVLPFGNFSTTQNLYDIMCYVPANHFTDLEPFLESVEKCLNELYPRYKSLHTRTTSFYDEDAKAYMASTQYVNYRKYYNN